MSKAIVFAGQGAQFVGMGKDLSEAYPECKMLFQKADDILGYGLSSICFDGPAEELTRTSHCQPGIFVASVACFTALKKELPELDIVASAGLSLGEWSALHAAGVLSFEDTVKVLEARGRFMQDACDQSDGGMCSVIGLTVDQCRDVAETAGAEMANLNSAAQTVLSGDQTAVEKAAVLAKEAGAKLAVPLKVAGAYHSSLMAPAAERLAEVLETVTFNAPDCPVVANVTGAPHGDPASIKDTMLAQVTSSVLWQKSIEGIIDQGVDTFVECGPGKVLSGLIKRINKRVTSMNVQDVDTLKAACEGLS